MQDAIKLLSGEFYSYTDPKSNKWTIEDVALGLSHICRYAGQVKKLYSVAQHAYYVSYCVPEEFAMDGLCHDNVEAFLVDIPTPLKRMLPEYKKIEAQHEAEMFSRLGLQYPMHPEVHKADLRVFGAEVRDLQPANTNWDCLIGVEPYEAQITPWSSEKARRMFLQRYYELSWIVKRNKRAAR